MTCKCSDNRTPCQKCIGKARDYFNLQFPEIECCHHKHMKITLATQDAENKELWQIYQDLHKIKLPIKEYINDKTIIGKEIFDKMCDIQDTWFYSRKGESWNSDMVKLILKARSSKKKLNLFDIDDADFTIIKNEMHFFGSDLCNNLDYFTYYFIYDILCHLTNQYVEQKKKFKETFKKLEALEKSGKYPSKMDDPTTYIQKSVFYAIIKDLVNYFKSN